MIADLIDREWKFARATVECRDGKIATTGIGTGLRKQPEDDDGIEKKNH
jgi:hypothetical protein